MNRTSNYIFTIIVPLFNECDNIARLNKELGEYIAGAAKSSCVMFINDGSTDNSQELLNNICAENSSFFVISLSKNSGLSAALKAGFDNTFSPYVGYIDADLQTTPKDFDKLFEAIGNNAMSIGYRADRKDGFVKRVSSLIANNFRRSMTGDTAIDTGCPIKIIKTEYAKKFPMFTGMHRFLPALIMLQNGTYAQSPIQHFPRIAGTSKYHLFNRLVSPFMDCFGYRWMKKRYINYSIKETNL